MMAEWLDLHWARPWVLGAVILLLPYFGLRGWILRDRAVGFAPLQYRRGPGGLRSFAARLQRPLEVLLLTALLLALAGPYRETTVDLLEDEGVDVALVLDVSLSMLAEDFPPTRLAALQRIARDFITRSGSNRTALLLFAGDTFVQAPLTDDHPALFSLLEGATVYTLNQNEGGGTAIGDALLTAAEMLQGARIEGRDQAVILITDGESNQGLEPELAARYIHQLEIHFYAVGVGGEEPVPVLFEGAPIGDPDDPYEAYLDDTQLRNLAELAEGRYYRASDADALDAIFHELSRLETAPLERRQIVRRASVVQPFALASFGLFLGVMWLNGMVLRRPFR